MSLFGHSIFSRAFFLELFLTIMNDRISHTIWPILDQVCDYFMDAEKRCPIELLLSIVRDCIM